MELTLFSSSPITKSDGKLIISFGRFDSNDFCAVLKSIFKFFICVSVLHIVVLKKKKWYRMYEIGSVPQS